MFAEDKLIEQDQPEQQVFNRRKKQGESSRFTLSHVVTLKRCRKTTLLIHGTDMYLTPRGLAGDCSAIIACL